MKRRGKLLTGFGIFMLLLVVFYIDTSVYPFTSQKPNFADVERVFDRMQFPAEWQEIRSSENRGIGGRRCPIESPTRCFHKSKTFSIPDTEKTEDIKNVLLQTRCPTVSTETVGYETDTEETKSLRCFVEGVEINGGHKGSENEAYISVGS